MIGTDPIKPGRTAEATLFLPDGPVALSIEIIWWQPRPTASYFAMGCRHVPWDTESGLRFGAFLQDLSHGGAV